MEQDNLRIRLNALVADYGSTLAYVCRQTHITAPELTKFKKRTLCLSPSQAERLNAFLAERGYDDDLDAFGSIVQGRYNN